MKFADDTKVNSKANNQQDSIQHDAFMALCKWANDWHIEFNPTKCKVVYYII